MNTTIKTGPAPRPGPGSPAKTCSACVLAVALALVVGGCAVTKPFKSGRAVSIGPFAENTVGVVQDIASGMSTEEVTYLRPYINTPEVAQYRASWERLRPVLRGVVAYSIEVMTLAEADWTSERKAQALGDYLDQLMEPVQTEPRPPLNLSKDEIANIIQQVKSSKGLVEALGHTQPVVDEAVRASLVLVDDIQAKKDAARAVIAGRVTADHAATLSARDTLRVRFGASVRHLVWLDNIQLGQMGSIDSLVAEDPLASRWLRHGRVSPGGLDSAGTFYLRRLERMDLLRKQLEGDLETYENKMRELDDQNERGEKSIRQVKVALLVWRRAHQNFARGIVTPATVDMFGVLKNVAKIPL